MKINGKTIGTMKFAKPYTRKLTADQMVSHIQFILCESFSAWDEDDVDEVLAVIRAYRRGFFSFEDVMSIIGDEYPQFRWPWQYATLVA